MKDNIFLEKINIRVCGLADYKFVCDLSKQNMEKYTTEYWGKWDSKKFKASLKAENIKIVNYGKKKIGFFDITNDGDLVYLHNIQIVNLFQSSGVGAKLMMEIEKMKKELGMKKIRAQVFKKNPAKFFYQKIGYKTVKRSAQSLIIEKIL